MSKINGVLIETLAAELARPRELSTQVQRHIAGTYEAERESIPAFLAERVAGLEEDEIDLMFSPLFTPILEDQTVVADLLGREAVPKDQWPALVATLEARPVEAQFMLDDVAYRVRLRAVTIERYIYRLRLDGSIPESLFALILRAPEADRPMLKAVARRTVWEAGSRRGILERYLQSTFARGTYTVSDAVHLLSLVESHKPADVDYFLAQLPRWQETLQRVLDTGLAGPSPFFSQHTEYQHGGERDQRVIDPGRVQVKRDELAFLFRIEEALAAHN